MTSRPEIDDAIMTVCAELDRIRASLDNCSRLLRTALSQLGELDTENAGLRAKVQFLEQRQHALDTTQR